MPSPALRGGVGREFGGSLSAPDWPEAAAWWTRAKADPATPAAAPARYAFLDALIPPAPAPAAGRCPGSYRRWASADREGSYVNRIYVEPIYVNGIY